ncbi:hypothetical protein [Streptomyces sp. NPDC046925]|uniref:hypothetical protein n=1 Tax=Streptomyces sp. NPDC046925 TaxID=3155375 RepID=UPI0033DED19B
MSELDEAVAWFRGLELALGEGEHNVSLCVVTPLGTAVLTLYSDEITSRVCDCAETLLGLFTLARLYQYTGGLVVRTTTDATETVRGWRLHVGQVEPLTEAEVFDAYCTDPNGDLVSPEPGTTYRAGVTVEPA